MKACLDCGAPTGGSRCAGCQRAYGGARPSRPHQRELSTAWWRRTSRLVLRTEPLCRRCKAEGKTTLATEVDHIIPREDGGSHERANLQPLCHSCHSAKTLGEARARGIIQGPSGRSPRVPPLPRSAARRLLELLVD